MGDRRMNRPLSVGTCYNRGVVACEATLGPLLGSPGRCGVSPHKREGPQGLQSPAPPAAPGPSPYPPPRCFRTWASASLTLSCLSLCRARSRRLPGRLLQLRVTSGSVARGRVPGLAEEGAAWAETRRSWRWEHHVSGGPTSPPIRVSGSEDWQRSSCWCPHHHHCPPRELGGVGVREPSTPD